MSEAVGRNDPCPCGSGKKYKSCHLGKVTPAVARRRAIIPVLAILAGVGLGAYIIATRGNIGAGIAFALAGIVIAAIIAVLRDPPPPDQGNKDAGAINFGG